MNTAVLWWPDLLAVILIGSSFIYMFATVLSKLKIVGKDEVKHQNMSSRPLGKMETVLHGLHKSGNLQVSMAAVVESSVKLEENVINNTIRYIHEMHPLLRMCIRETDNVPYFVPASKEIKVRTVTSESWHEVFEENMEHSLDSTESVWTLLMVEESEKSGHFENKNTKDNIFIFTFHHSIGDGLSMTRLVVDFIESLERTLRDKPLKSKSFSLLPPLDYFLDPLLKRSPSDQNIFRSFETMGSNLTSELLNAAEDKFLSHTKHTNLFINKIGAFCMVNPLLKAQTRMIPLVFKASETDQILKSCRANNTTIQGLLTASASISMRNLFSVHTDVNLNQNDLEVKSVPIRTTVNMRRYLENSIPNDYVGSYFVGLFSQEVPIPTGNNQLQQFWDCAKYSTENIHQQIKDRSFITRFWNSLETTYYKMKAQHPKQDKALNGHNIISRTSELISLNNYGGCPSQTQELELLHLKGCFSAVSEHKRGPIITINATTVANQLCLSFVYYTNITSPKMTVDFVQSVRNKIIKYCNL